MESTILFQPIGTEVGTSKAIHSSRKISNGMVYSFQPVELENEAKVSQK